MAAKSPSAKTNKHAIRASGMASIKEYGSMSGKRKKAGNKSGMLTGLMIVSTGLIVGYQGFDLAVSEAVRKPAGEGYSTLQPQAERARRISQRIDALDQIITASLQAAKAGEQPDALARLIENTRHVTPMQTAPLEAEPAAPIVNRALKEDRDPLFAAKASDARAAKANDIARKHADEEVSNRALSLSHARQGQEMQEERQADISAPQKKVSGHEVPFADSADIALFAADIPLPGSLTHGSRSGRGPSLLSRSFQSPYVRSPLVPRKFASGKAFGGLGELAFQKRERRCMTTALYFEARSEPEAGQIAVGQVVMNRVRSPDYPDTICGVVYQGSNRRTGCQFSFTCDGKVDKPTNRVQWERSKRLANQVLEGRVWLKSIGHATHYHATYVKPAWRRKMARVKQIGRHIFYKSPKVSVTETYQRYTTGKRS